MYCQICGTEIQKTLNYCNKCGARIGRADLSAVPASADLEATKSTFQSFSTAITVVGLGGLIATVVFGLKLLEKNVDVSAVVVIIAMFLAFILTTVYLLLRQLPGGRAAPIKEDLSEDYREPVRLKPVHTAQLEEPPDPVMSVTEQTTRTLDEVLVERK